MGMNTVIESLFSIENTHLNIFAFALIVLLGLAIPELIYRWKITPVPLLIIAGIVIGPHGFNIIDSHPGIEFLGELGILFLVFIAGLEVHKSKTKSYKQPILLAIISGTICFAGGFMVGRFWHFSIQTSLLLGSIMVSSSVGEIISIVNTTRKLKERFGALIIPGIVIMDAGSLILLAIIMKLEDGVLNILLFMVLAIGFIGTSAYAVPKIGRYIFSSGKRRASEHGFRFTIALLAVMVLISELIGLPGIVTAFLVGMFLGEVIPGRSVLSKVNTLGHGFLIPIFFINLGLTMNVRILITEPSNILMTGSIIATLMCMKILGGQIYGRLNKMDGRESLAVGVVLWPQLGATLAATAIGREVGIVPPELFVAVIAMAIVTALGTPFFVPLFAREKMHKRDFEDHIVILGSGSVGSALTEVLIVSDENFVVVENDLNTVNELRKKWVDVIYGDATELISLEEANVGGAKVIVVALPDTKDTFLAVKNARSLNEDCYIIAKEQQKRDMYDIEEHVDHVIRPDKLTAIEIVNRTLHILEREVDKKILVEDGQEI